MRRAGLARKSMGAGGLWLFAVGASSPMTVVAGGIVATYATTGVVGVPLAFAVLAAALGLLTVGFLAMGRHVPHAAAFYALAARGLGRPAGVAAAAVALLGYNAIQISLYGLFGYTVAGLIGGTWWMWSALVWAAVAAFGVLQIRLNARVLAWSLLVEIVVIAALDVGAFTNPAGGTISLTPLVPDSLLVDGVGGVLALSIAAFAGYECGPVFAEEARSPRAVAAATGSALAFLGVFYTISAWAIAVAVGPSSVAAEAADPAAGLPFSILNATAGPTVVWLATLLLVVSIFAAMLSFHLTVARYLYALGRERVLPGWLAGIGRGAGGGAPVGGSLVQTGSAFVVVAGFAVVGADPYTTLFTWLASVAAVAILLLLVTASWAALRFFRAGGGTNESAWVRVVAPRLGVGAGVAVLAVTVANLASLLGVPPGSVLTRVIPGSVAVAAMAGLLWAAILRRRRPDVFARIGHGRPNPLATPEQRLAGLDL
jgi:amino acid transporter